MTLVLVGIAVLLVAGVALFLLKSRNTASAPASAPRQVSAHQAPKPPETVVSGQVNTHPPHSSSGGMPAPAAHRDLPAELGSFAWTPASGLSTEKQQELLAKLRQIPRPSQALHQLVSPEFIQNASSIALSELVLGEPHIAAKVLATVNAPLYGLQRPVVSIGQGVTFLGLNTVRGICLQYLLNESFKPSSPEVKKVFDTLWGASSLASELCQRLTQKLNLPDSGAMVTQLVLSFLGHLAALSQLPADKVLSSEQQSLLARLRLQQEAIGLNAVEIGRLLMHEWALPESIVDSVTAIDQSLVMPVTGQPPSMVDVRRALSYVCARLGEQLAFGRLQDLASYELMQDDGVDMFHLQPMLAMAPLDRLAEALRSPDVAGPVNQMAARLRTA